MTTPLHLRQARVKGHTRWTLSCDGTLALIICDTLGEVQRRAAEAQTAAALVGWLVRL